MAAVPISKWTSAVVKLSEIGACANKTIYDELTESSLLHSIVLLYGNDFIIVYWMEDGWIK